MSHLHPKTAPAVFLVLAALATPCAAATAERIVPSPPLRLPPDATTVNVPVSLAGDRLYTRVRVNGQDAGWFLIDTCAPLTSVDETVARRLKLTTRQMVATPATAPAPAAAPAPAPADLNHSHLTAVVELALGDATAPRLLVNVYDLTHLGRMEGISVSGIVGGDLLGSQPFTLDFTTPALTLHDRARFTPPAGGGDGLELDRGGNSYPALRGSVDGHSGWFLFDTGNDRGTVLTEPFARIQRIQKIGPQTRVGTARGMRRLELLRFGTINLFGRQREPAIVMVARDPIVHEAVDAHFAGIAGVPEMRGGRFTFDYERRRAWVEWPEASAEELANRLTDPRRADLAGETPLMKAARLGRADAVALLLERGADVNARSAVDATALLCAAEAGDAEITRQLLRAGADANRQSVFEAMTALHRAAERGHTEVVRSLVSAKGIVIDCRTTLDETPLHRAAAGGYLDVVTALLDAGADVNAASRGGVTTLMWAAAAGDAGTLNLLLDRGADIARRSGRRDTALHWAVTAASMRVLLDRGAGVNDANVDGRTALMQAARRGREDVLRLLVSRGADVTLRTKDGKTAADGAAERGLYHVLHLITPPDSP